MMTAHLQRREFITLLGGAAAAWPLAARAQQRTMPVVGYLVAGTPEAGAAQMAAFRKGLSESGFVEGRNVAIEYRWGNNDTDRLPDLAADLVRRRVAVISTPGSTQASLTAKAATATIPIVFWTGGDPIQLGLVASFNRPGGNLTGINSMNTELAGKRLALLHELVPRAARIGVLVNPNNPQNETIATDAQTAAVALGIQVEILSASTARDIDTVFASLGQKRVEGLVVAADSLFVTRRVQLASAAMRHALPTIYQDRLNAEAGGLMSYGASILDQFRQAGIYTGRILKGEKPADLPVMRPTKFEFVINLQSARLLGIEVPPTLLAIADEVIE